MNLFRRLEKEWILALGSNNLFLILLTFLIAIGGIYLSVVLKRKTKKNSIFIFLIFTFWFGAAFVSFVGLLSIIPLSFLYLIVIAILGSLLIYGPSGLKNFYFMEKFPKPWWRKDRPN